MSAIETTDPRVVRAVLGRLAEQNERTARPMAERITRKATAAASAKREQAIEGPTDAQDGYIRKLLADLGKLNADQAARVTEWYDRGISKARASKFIDELKAQITAQTPAAPAAEPRRFDDFADVPDGNYAIMRDREADHVDFYRVSREQGKGKWAGRTFVKVQERAGGELYPIEPKGRQFAILREIREAGPKASAELYATKERRCYACNTQLTDPTSRAELIGPECKRKGRGF
jgi:hypothetical protein